MTHMHTHTYFVGPDTRQAVHSSIHLVRLNKGRRSAPAADIDRGDVYFTDSDSSDDDADQAQGDALAEQTPIRAAGAGECDEMRDSSSITCMESTAQAQADQVRERVGIMLELMRADEGESDNPANDSEVRRPTAL